MEPPRVKKERGKRSQEEKSTGTHRQCAKILLVLARRGNRGAAQKGRGGRGSDSCLLEVRNIMDFSVPALLRLGIHKRVAQEATAKFHLGGNEKNMGGQNRIRRGDEAQGRDQPCFPPE